MIVDFYFKTRAGIFPGTGNNQRLLLLCLALNEPSHPSGCTSEKIQTPPGAHACTE